MSELQKPADTEPVDDRDIVVLTDETGAEQEYERLKIIPYEDKDYIILMPVDSDDGQVEIFQVELEEGTDEMYFNDVEDDAVLEAVFERFREWFADEYDFE